MAQYNNNMTNFFSRMIFGNKSAKRYTTDYASGSLGVAPNPEQGDFQYYLENDPDFAANIRRFVDNVMIKSPRVVSTGAAVSTVESYNKQLRDVRFYKNMRAALYQLVGSGNAFFELKFSGKRLKELYTIDSNTMKIHMTDDGREVAYYEQELNGSPVVRFMPDEIVHISIDHLDSGVLGNAFIKPLLKTLKRKAVAESYLEWLISKNKTSPIAVIKAGATMDDENWERIIAEINATENDPDLTHVIGLLNDDEVEIKRLFTFEDVDTVLKYIDSQNQKIMSLLQVPPIIAGTVDNSNRSNSEIQARLVFYNTIKSMQNSIIEELNFEMLRKLNWNGVSFKFPEVDERMNVELIKLAKSMKLDLNMTDEVIEAFLISNGFNLPEIKKLFNMGVSEPSNDINDMPSREPRDKTGIPQNEEQRLSDREAGM